MARVLCVSTYELGRQPQHLATLAASLLEAGHQARCTDTAVDPLRAADVDWAECVVVAVPMHTATRLAADVVGAVRSRRGTGVRVGVVGLYAEVARRSLGDAVDWAVAGEFEAEATRLAGGAEPQADVVVLDRLTLPLPVRDLLPGLDRYARFLIDGEARPAGYVEASRGCVHRCRHCPVPVVYAGRMRIRAAADVVADAVAQWRSGARHITLGDPDALNSLTHTLRVLRGLHAALPEATVDLTVKIEHIVRHSGVWAELRGLGVVAVTTALETTDETVLRILDKGHTRDSAREAVRILRCAGVEIRPSLLPFTPWTSLGSLLRLHDDLAAWDLLGSVDPVQLGIRLLVPDGSLLLGHAEMSPHLTGTTDAGGHTWRHPDPAMDALHAGLAALVAAAADAGADPAQTHRRIRTRLGRAAAAAGMGWDSTTPPVDTGMGAAPGARPRLSEAWFCCAEPTSAQLTALRGDCREAPQTNLGYSDIPPSTTMVVPVT